MQNGPVDGNKSDPRCCLIEWLRDPCDKEANALALSHVEFTSFSQNPTDLWSALSTNELQKGAWNFVDGPVCRVATNLTKGDQVVMRFPPGWSGNTFATKADWEADMVGRQVKWGGAAHSVLLEYTFGCTECGDDSLDEQFWWDLSAIPNSEPGQCVASGLLHHSCKQEPSQCAVELAGSAIVYGNNDHECKGKTGHPMDPDGWFQWQFGKANGDWALVPSWGTDGRAKSANAGYRYNWFGSPACYNYDDCKSKATNGGVDAYLNGRGFKVDVPIAAPDVPIYCYFDGWKGYWQDSNHKSVNGSVTEVLCTHGTNHSTIAGADQDCMTSPHEDWKSLACKRNVSRTLPPRHPPPTPPITDSVRNAQLAAMMNGTVVLRVSICQWHDVNCTGEQLYPDVPAVPNVCKSKCSCPLQLDFQE